MAVNDFAVPPTLTFLDSQHKVKQLGVDVLAEQLADREVIVVLDTTAWIQLGKMGDVIRRSTAIKAVLDHHVSGDDLGAELFKSTSAEATGRLVIEAADVLGVPLTPEIARPAFAALATDTGWFRFASTTADTLRLAGRLIDAGSQPDLLYKHLYEHDSLARLQLIGRTLARTRAELGGRLVHTWIERSDFAATGALASDTEDIINMTLTVDGTEVAVILVELANGQFKLSLRSRSERQLRQAGRDLPRRGPQEGGRRHPGRTAGSRTVAGAATRPDRDAGIEKKIRNLKSQIRNKFQFQNRKVPNIRGGPRATFRSFPFLCFEFVWNFGVAANPLYRHDPTHLPRSP